MTPSNSNSTTNTSLNTLSTRNTQQNSPPIKQRKALSEAGDKINQSPRYSSSSLKMTAPHSPRISLANTANTNIQRPTKISIGARRRTHTQVPVSSVGFTNSAAHTHLRSVSDSSTSSTSRLSSKIAQPLLKHTRTTTQRTSASFSLLQDPDALKRQLQNQERLMKQMSEDQERINQYERKISDARNKNSELDKKKERLAREISGFKSKISTMEAELINVDYKLENAKHAASKEIHHEEQMQVLKLKEYQHTLMRELDETEAGLQQGLNEIRLESDEISETEILEMEKQLNELQKDSKLLNEKNEIQYREEIRKLDEILDTKTQNLEKECEKLTKDYERTHLETSNFNERLNAVQLEVDTITKEIETIKEKIEKQSEIKSTGESNINDLVEKIRQLEKDNEQIDNELQLATVDANTIDQKYQESVSKIHKELQYKRRIENSIQDLLGKLRVFIRLLPSQSQSLEVSTQEQDPSYNTLTVKDDSYHFNKIFTHDSSDQAVAMESSTICESALNGCNVSIILSGIDDESLTAVLLKQCITTLQEREERYTKKQWKFQYGVQAVSITPDGVFDTMNSKPVDIKLENRCIVSSAITSSVDDLTGFDTLENSSTFVKVSISATSPTKSFDSYLYLFNLSRIESFDLIYNTTTKVSQSKYSTAEFEHSMYQLVHSLYSNTKALTICNVEDSDTKETVKWLELAKFVSGVNGAPVKRVYSKLS